jgi:catechol 2,3-dioxygenase-like lactoylglutathione lyase family enzyme
MWVRSSRRGKERLMPVELNHTIVYAKDNEASAAFLADILGLAPPTRYGPFMEVKAANNVSLDFMTVGDNVVAQHYAFLITEDEFDEIFGRITARSLGHWADPHKQQPGEINHGDGGRGVYFDHPDGHLLEILTRPYGSGAG